MRVFIVFSCCLLTISTVVSQDLANITCGVATVQPVTTRIVGGVAARPGSWPWLVLIADSKGYVVGSGTILHPHVILTSAQHFRQVGFPVESHDIHFWRIYAGEYDISRDDPHETFYHISRVVLHPGYNYTSLENDLALVLTNEPIVYNPHTRPACLPEANDTCTFGQTCYLPGWGNTAKTGNEEVMNQVDLPILNDTVCSMRWTDFIPDTELCAGYENAGKDFCSDDIGSPLMCADDEGVWYVQGIASAGGDCTKANQPGIFEDVGMYSDWIKTTMTNAGYAYVY